MEHIKALDGIRAIAVYLVILFHLGLFPPGWIGVQIFFVLSGYLITGILLRAKTKPLSEYLGRFYWRRSLRIFPLYFSFLIAACVCYLTIAWPESLGRDWPWLATYTVNFARLREIDIGPAFVHLWSLAVEEQFYVIWPLIVFFLPPAAFKNTVILIFFLSPFSRLFVYYMGQGHSLDWIGRTIYGLPSSQLDAFAAGALVAIRPVRHTGALLLALIFLTGVAGGAVILHQHLTYHAAMKWSFGYAMFLMQDGGFVWGYSLLNITSAAAIAYTIKTRPRWLGSAPIARIGAISYGIYVYHLPLLLAFQSLQLKKHVMIPLFLMVTLLVAELSFRFLEAPFLRIKDRIDSRQQPADGNITPSTEPPLR